MFSNARLAPTMASISPPCRVSLLTGPTPQRRGVVEEALAEEAVVEESVAL